MFAPRLLAGLLLLGTVAAPNASAAYRVRYRPAPQARWQVYATTPTLAIAQSDVAQLQAGGYPAQYVVVQPAAPATLPAAGYSSVTYHDNQFHHAGYQTHHYGYVHHDAFHHAVHHRVVHHHVVHHHYHVVRYHHVVHHHHVTHYHVVHR